VCRHCDQVPRASYNFLALCASGYYNETTFHRNIKGFMVQGGDPTATGKGGSSVFDEPKFEDEIVQSLKHDKIGVVSMANSGPNTNGVIPFLLGYRTAVFTLSVNLCLRMWHCSDTERLTFFREYWGYGRYSNGISSSVRQLC
jgi:hypothetical protein